MLLMNRAMRITKWKSIKETLNRRPLLQAFMMVSSRFVTILLLTPLTASVTASGLWDDGWNGPWHQHHQYLGHFPWHHQEFNHYPHHGGYLPLGH
ncbi:putative glucose-6-phosphate/phosphate-translocator-like protein [Dirofilaria immitis]